MSATRDDVDPTSATTGTTDPWDPGRYLRFGEQRARPFFDLLELVTPVPGGEVVDLGCGSGELTAHLHTHTRARRTVGIDSSPAMLAEARRHAGDGLTFELGDIAALDAGRPPRRRVQQRRASLGARPPPAARAIACRASARRSARGPGAGERRPPVTRARHRDRERVAISRGDRRRDRAVRPGQPGRGADTRAVRGTARRAGLRGAARAIAGVRPPPGVDRRTSWNGRRGRR